MSIGFALTVLAALTLSYLFYTRLRRTAQLNYIRNYSFHPAIKEKLKRKYPTLSDSQLNMVFDGLRDYFRICNKARGKTVSMPSQVVDDAWHELILFTLIYQRFCAKALGRFLHHTPAEAMRTPITAQAGIKRAWRLACTEEGINPRAPQRLPRLFAMDALLAIENGFIYSLNCQDRNSPNYGDGYCATHIGCSSGCSGSGSDYSDTTSSTSGSDCGTSGSSSGGDSSGCCGSSCGGGGCGGGGD